MRIITNQKKSNTRGSFKKKTGVHEKTREKNSEQIIKRKKKNICIIEGEKTIT